MEENKSRRRWFRISIRDLLWAMVVAGLTLALVQQRALWWETAVDLKDEATKRTLAETQLKHTQANLDELIRLIEAESEADPTAN